MKNLLPVLSVLLIFSSCKKKEVFIPVEKVIIDQVSGASLNIRLGEPPGQLTATVLPINATEKAVTWTSSDASIATVSAGLVTAVKVGETIISAKAGNITADFIINVLPAIVAVTDISLNPSTVDLVIGESSLLKATVIPENATDRTIMWSSTNEGIATVNNGVITAKAVGTCTINAKSFSDQTKSAACSVTVVAQAIPITGISLDSETANLIVNGTRLLTVKITPEKATRKAVRWSTSNSAVAEVSAEGLVTAKGVGLANIIVAAVNDASKTAACKVTVTDREVAVTRITATPADTTVAAGASFQLRHKTEPENATNVNVTYESSDETKAIVLKTGLVITRATGEVTLTVKSVADLTKMGTCRLTIRPSVESILVSPHAVSLSKGQKQQLAATVMPSNAANTKVTWSSEDVSKAIVSNSGEVTAVGPGRVVITATAGDGSQVTGSSVITVAAVAAAVAGISLEPSKANVVLRRTSKLVASIVPENAIDKTVVWSSGDESIALVNNGVVTAMALGTCVITAKSFSDQTKAAICAVTVVAQEIPVTAISLDPVAANILVKDTRQLKATLTPESATDKNVTWSTSNAAVAEVSSTGLVTAKSVGPAFITLVCVADPAKTATCTITVTDREVAVTGISSAPADTTVAVGAFFQLRHRIEPAHATNVNTTYESEDVAKALVSEKGLVSAKAAGVVTVTVKSAADPTKVSTCRLTVRPRVQSITLAPLAANLSTGQKQQLIATVMPDAANQRLIWISADESKATVSNSGEVTAAAPGVVRITAHATDGSNITGSSTLTITTRVVAVAGISLDPATVSIIAGDTKTVVVTLAPADATDRIVVWISDKENIATVHAGVITAKAAGTCIITAKSFSDQTKTATCAVTVVAREVPATGISLDATKANILVNDTRQLTETITPQNATNKNVRWSTSDAAVAEVSTEGLVTAKRVGYAIITVASAYDPAKTAACAITVTDREVAVTDLTAAPSDTTVAEGSIFRFRHRITPADATNVKVTYESSDEAKTLISVTGFVTARAAGSATVTVKSVADPTKMATCRLTIRARIQSITVSPYTATVATGQRQQLTATVMPDEAADNRVTWSSADEAKATVSASGEVTAGAPGQVRITATAGDGSHITGSAIITVIVNVATISVAPSSVSIVNGETSTLTATLTPGNATDKTVVWTSDKEDIATVSNGVVRARAAGTCNITAQSVSDPSKTAVCAVTVTARAVPVAGISLDAVVATIFVNGTRQLTATIAPENATDKNVTWSTSNAAVAEVSTTGLVTAKAAGSATITVTGGGTPAKTAACAITVAIPDIVVTALTVAPADTAIVTGTSFQLRRTITPANATHRDLTYESGDATKAIVSATGLVLARAEGTVTLTVKSAADPTKSAVCRLTVKVGVQSITLSPGGGSIFTGQKRQLTAAILPLDAADKTVTWSSSNAKATVSAGGEVTATDPGQVVISATAKDGSGITGRTTITLIRPVSSITIVPENPVAVMGTNRTLTATVLPADATQTVTWTSSDHAKATIDPATGTVTPAGAGTTLITATTTDGSLVKGESLLTVQNKADASRAAITAITLGAENFEVPVPALGTVVTLNNIPRTVASNITQVQVNITATAGAVIRTGRTVRFQSGDRVDFTNSVTFSVSETGSSGTRDYTLFIRAYNAATNPYGIYTVAHLHDVRNGMNLSFKLMNDLTMPAASVGVAGIDDYATAGWWPIGRYDIHFEGTLDGGGHSIDNFFIDRSRYTPFSVTGLFAFVGSSGTIKNLGINTVNEENRGVSGANQFLDQYVGILTGYSEGTLENCYTTGKVFAHSRTQHSGQTDAGGLAGRAKGQVRRCYSTATVSVRATVDGVQRVYAGGLLGYSEAAVSDSYATGAVQGIGPNVMTAYAGGLAGYSGGGSLTRCYAAGDVNAVSSSTAVRQGASAGGLIGGSACSISNCYALGNVTSRLTVQSGNTSCAGGLVGWATGSAPVSNCYAVGNTLASGAHELWVGGLVGIYENRGIFNNCYRNSNATRINSNGGYTNTSEDDLPGSRLAPKPLAEMKTEAFKGLLNGSSGTAWGRRSGTNNNLPYLIDVGAGR